MEKKIEISRVVFVVKIYEALTYKKDRLYCTFEWELS